MARYLRFPKLMTVGWSRRLIETCAEAMEEPGPLIFDLRRVEWVAPFGVTLLSATLLACLADEKECTYVPPQNSTCKDYLTRIGFDAIFLPHGVEALHHSTSVELRRLTDINPVYAQNLIEVMAFSIGLTDEQQSQIYMHLIELMQNAKDHAHSEMGYFVCAQWYPAKRNLRISFVDVGRGIPTVLRTLRQFASTRNDSDLLLVATEEGVTTRKGLAGGMGLAFIRNYVRESGGTLTIISERGKIAFQPKKIARYKKTLRFPGTAIDITMRTGS
jgi:anti-sigma regulatory factor (Ser/Thr protein kinase)